MKVGSYVGMLLTVLLFAANTTAAKEVDWSALNPAFKGASYVKDSKTCMGCHEEAHKHFSETAHAKAFKFGKAPAGGECESCHGPRSNHVADENGEKREGKTPGSGDYAMTKAQQAAICLQCHEGKNQKYWKSSQHAAADVSCTSCHSVMQKKSDRALLAATRVDGVCYTCHSNVRAEMNKASHHPVREGKVSCTGCHNPHGSVTAGMLKGASVNETCYGCHQEKRGPFVWEHAPARESCLNCHEQHGSNNRKLLNRKDSFLCMQCHTFGGHMNLPRYNRVSNPYGEGCINCHMAVHGSNSPSGAKLTR